MKGKVAIITASSTGIGKAIAVRLAEEGVKVVISSRNKENIDAAVREIRERGLQAYGVVCHVGKQEDRERLVSETIEKYGQIDYLVPNAAVSIRMKGYFDATEGQIQKMFDINYKSVYFLIKCALPHLKKQKGSIVIISTYGSFQIPLMAGQYSITKMTQVGMTRVMSRLLMDDGIRVNCVCPGLVKTQFSRYLWEDEKLKSQVLGRYKGNRFGQPQEISGAVKFLLSDEASYITGESMVLAGRPSARL